MKRIKIYMGLPSMGDRSSAQVVNLRLIEEKYKDKIELVYPKVHVQRLFHDFARNAIVNDFLKTDCDILWFVDSDVSPPVDILDLVTEHGDKWSLAGAAYPVFMSNNGEKAMSVVWTAYTKVDGKLTIAPVYKRGCEFVDGLATGCLFIRRGIFDLLKPPYFAFKYDEETCGITEGEDLGFCRKVNALGYQFFTDWDKVCRHIKTVDLLDVNNYAIDLANAKLQAYDQQIRPHIEELEKRLRGKTGPQEQSKLILPDRFQR